MKPATPLPWFNASISWVQPKDGAINTPQANLGADTDFALHACNAYPQLVAALRTIGRQADMHNMQEADGFDALRDQARTLLRSLGEDA